MQPVSIKTVITFLTYLRRKKTQYKNNSGDFLNIDGLIKISKKCVVIQLK